MKPVAFAARLATAMEPTTKKPARTLAWRCLAVLALLAVTVAGCWDTKRNPLYCDGAALRCEDPARPSCEP